MCSSDLLSPITIHDQAFAGQTAADKRTQIADALRGENIDAAVLTAPDSIAWLLNIRGNDVAFSPLALSFAVLHADGSVDLFMDGGKLSPATKDHLGPEVRALEPDAFGPALDALGKAGRTVRLDPATAPAGNRP